MNYKTRVRHIEEYGRFNVPRNYFTAGVKVLASTANVNGFACVVAVDVTSTDSWGAELMSYNAIDLPEHTNTLMGVREVHDIIDPRLRNALSDLFENAENALRGHGYNQALNIEFEGGSDEA